MVTCEWCNRDYPEDECEVVEMDGALKDGTIRGYSGVACGNCKEYGGASWLMQS